MAPLLNRQSAALGGTSSKRFQKKVDSLSFPPPPDLQTAPILEPLIAGQESIGQVVNTIDINKVIIISLDYELSLLTVVRHPAQPKQVLCCGPRRRRFLCIKESRRWTS